MTVALVAILGLFMAFGWLAYRNLRLSFLALIFLAPWYGVDLDIGLRITAFQICLIPVLIFTLKEMYLTKSNTLLIFFILYSICWTLGQAPFLPEALVTGGILRTPMMRSFLQIPMFLLTISPLFVAQSIIKTESDLVLAGKTYILSCVCLAIIGWIQLALWYKTGVNYLPIGLTNNLLGGMAEVRDGYYVFADMNIYRMNSLGGEPKNLAAAFAVGLLLIQTALPLMRSTTISVVWLLLAFSMAATMSTTGFLLWTIGTTIQLVLVCFGRKFDNDYRKSYFTYMMCFIILLGLAIATMEAAGLSIIKLVQDRTLDRFTSSELGALEDFDAAIIEYFKDNPIDALGGVGFGNIHLYARPYLISSVFAYAGKSVFTAKAQYLKIISETGVISLMIFLLWGLRLLMQRARGILAPADANYSTLLVIFGASMFTIYLSAGTIAPQFFLAMGAIGAHITTD